MQPESPRLICLTPCRNEAWVIGTHLSGASQWADRIVLGDQNSTDDTRAVAAAFPKCDVVTNSAEGYDEGERHRVVFEAARRLFPGEKRILLAIDSDEILSANWATSPEWERIKQLPPGAAIYAEWANVNPDFATWFPLGGPFIIGVVDDGRISHSPGQFHVPRLLCDPHAPAFTLREIRLLHLQYTDAERSQSKNRAYQVQEWLVNPTRPIRLFRRFNSTLKVRRRDIQALRPEWTRDFNRQGVRWDDIRKDGLYRWDKLVAEALVEKGPAFFRRLDIWDVEWAAVAARHGVPTRGRDLRDPRTAFDKAVHWFLRRTQPLMAHPAVRLVQWLLRLFKW